MSVGYQSFRDEQDTSISAWVSRFCSRMTTLNLSAYVNNIQAVDHSCTTKARSSADHSEGFKAGFGANLFDPRGGSTITSLSDRVQLLVVHRDPTSGNATCTARPTASIFQENCPWPTSKVRSVDVCYMARAIPSFVLNGNEESAQQIQMSSTSAEPTLTAVPLCPVP